MSLFVLEIGSEEIPARFLDVENAELQKRFSTAFEEVGIAYGAIKVLSSPRRAVLFVEDIEAVQVEKEELVSGPPERIAYDSEGKPTKALEGFLRTNNVTLEDIFLEDTPKGKYLAVRKKTGGASVAKLLEEICPSIISALPFAKKMRWGANSFAYARPLRWVVALFDEAIVPFSVGPVTSGRHTWGHRIHGKSADQSLLHEVPSAQKYLEVVRAAGVEPDAAKRRQSIIDAGNALAAELGGKILWKESLLDEVQGLVEHAVPIIGNFDASFLEVPREALLTSMESHQKSFGVEDSKGTLLPHFLTVLNMTPVDMSIVQKGWERVLRARLEDARFFWNSDLQSPLESWLEKLDSVIFLGPLGSMGDKTRRLEKLCLWLKDHCGVQEGLPSATEAGRAGRLSKADLVSGMVGEFDTLQGIMGGIYASKKEESQAVCVALQEQYLPAGPHSPVPSTLLGALLSMADKADTLVGCFGLGMIPTGTADPNGLRRCVLGITRCIIEFNLRLDVRAFLAEALSLYGQKAWKLEGEACLQKLDEFFAARVKNFLQGQGADTLLVDATLGAGSNDIWTAAKRLQALEKFHASEHYTASVQTFKRVANIIRKQGQDLTLSGVYDVNLAQEDAEKALMQKLDALLPRFDALWQEDFFDAIPGLLLDVRPFVDAFFDSVMVMCDDEAVRLNRLNVLKALTQRMEKFADFAALQV